MLWGIPRPLRCNNNRRQRHKTLRKPQSQRRKRKAFGAVYLAVLTIRKIIKEPSPRPPRPRETAGRTKEALHGSLQPLVNDRRTSGIRRASARPRGISHPGPCRSSAHPPTAGKCHSRGTRTEG